MTSAYSLVMATGSSHYIMISNGYGERGTSDCNMRHYYLKPTSSTRENVRPSIKLPASPGMCGFVDTNGAPVSLCMRSFCGRPLELMVPLRTKGFTYRQGSTQAPSEPCDLPPYPPLQPKSASNIARCFGGHGSGKLQRKTIEISGRRNVSSRRGDDR